MNDDDKPYLGTLLVDRFDALPRRTRNSILDRPTLGEAIVATIQHIHGATAYATEHYSDPLSTHRLLLVAYRLDDVDDWTQRRFQDLSVDSLPETGRYVQIAAGDTAMERWATAHARGWRYLGRRRRTLRHRRVLWLRFPLRSALLGNYTIDDHLHQSRTADQYVTGIGLPLWWEARMREGHTPESAWMMLGLTIDPTILATLVYRDQQHPVVQREVVQYI